MSSSTDVLTCNEKGFLHNLFPQHNNKKIVFTLNLLNLFITIKTVFATNESTMLYIFAHGHLWLKQYISIYKFK